MLVLVFALYAAHTVFKIGGRRFDSLTNDDLYNAVVLGSALTLLVRAASSTRNRRALLFIGTGLFAWALGDLCYTIYFSSLANPPFPSFDDALYLSFYPLMYVGLGLLIRNDFRSVQATEWLDGLVAGLGLSALAVAFVLGPVLSGTGGSVAAVATNLAYPIGDLLLFLVALTAISLSCWRPGRRWALIASSVMLNAVADSIYLYQVATGTFVEGAWTEGLWLVSALLLVAAFLVRGRAPAAGQTGGWRTIVVPVIGALAALAVLFVDYGTTRINDPARYLALATLLIALIRALFTFRAAQVRERRSRAEAVTDPLTGLGNRRALAEHLETVVADATAEDPTVVVLYDLNGFKHYNDSFGHPAGDSLLVRLGQNLAATIAPHGRAYRMGGDEFCALITPKDAPVEALLTAAAHSLMESGDGFEIDAASGAITLPFDARTASDALQLADRRLYAVKEYRPSGVKRQLRSVLLQVLDERESALHEHLEGTAALALAVGRRMELDPEELDAVVRGAELHDVGKMAIPDTILTKPGPLNEEEWAFMRRHTILGERILAAAPALIPVSKLVRASHERWDGNGYPDGLAGEDIPLGARIICACDAYNAMISKRVYSRAKTQHEAILELSANAGSQFDPHVVEELIAVIRDEAHVTGDRDYSGPPSAPRPLARAG